jgi:hypothetical protein
MDEIVEVLAMLDEFYRELQQKANQSAAAVV